MAEHPSHAAATALLAKLAAAQNPLCISNQVCREFLVVLTRKAVSGREFTVEEALQALDVWESACVVLDESAAVLKEVPSPRVTNTKNGGLYHLVFAAKHDLGDKIWKSIAKTTRTGQGSLPL